ncbi:ROK family glucokinase [Bilifractor sp. HCP3S3_D3]|uniref:ROK family glucokinase n=1 Tax=unclassified Bilifractor TaxID=2815795 RepID=UPI003F8C8562|nr:ROK family glucokinase [Eubacterium sp.]
MKPYAVGVDVGGTTVKIGIFRTSGDLLLKWEIVTDKKDGGRNILPDIADSIKSMLSNKGIGLDEIQGVGIGIPGAILNRSIVNRAVNLGWDVVPVKDQLEQLFDGKINVLVGNDANVAALGEMWQGGGKGFKDIVMVTLGTGVGGGIIINEQILDGTFGAAGEIGHMPVNPQETRVCGCGKKGHLEQYASATGIANTAKAVVASTKEETELKGLDSITAKDVFDAAKRGDKVALEIVDYTAEILGRGLAMVAAVVDPQAFVIGGGVSKAGPILTDSIQKYYRKYAFHASEDTKFVLATLGNDAGIYGAVRMVL